MVTVSTQWRAYWFLFRFEFSIDAVLFLAISMHDFIHPLVLHSHSRMILCSFLLFKIAKAKGQRSRAIEHVLLLISVYWNHDFDCSFVETIVSVCIVTFDTAIIFIWNFHCYSITHSMGFCFSFFFFVVAIDSTKEKPQKKIWRYFIGPIWSLKYMRPSIRWSRKKNR